MFEMKDGKLVLDDRSQRLLAEQTIHPLYGRSPGMEAMEPFVPEPHWLDNVGDIKKAECHCGKDGHALNSVNCPVHGYDVVRRVPRS